MPYKLMLLDCRMPGMDGFEVAERLKARGEHSLTVLMLSSDDLKADVARAYSGTGCIPGQTGARLVCGPEWVAISDGLRVSLPVVSTPGAAEYSYYNSSPTPMEARQILIRRKQVSFQIPTRSTSSRVTSSARRS
jgi:CheY-like chemotaxis protein